MKTTCVLLTIAVFCFPAVAAVADDLTVEAECGCVSECCQQHVEIIKETKYCWEVEQRQVCIPTACCPWLEWLPFGKGSIRTVNVLEKHEWECEKPVYKWVPVIEHCCASPPPKAGVFLPHVPTTLPQPHRAPQSGGATFLVRRIPSVGSEDLPVKPSPSRETVRR